VRVPELTEIQVASEAELRAALELANALRATAAMGESVVQTPLTVFHSCFSTQLCRMRGV
jgi:hypothetical protein